MTTFANCTDADLAFLLGTWRQMPVKDATAVFAETLATCEYIRRELAAIVSSHPRSH